MRWACLVIVAAMGVSHARADDLPMIEASEATTGQDAGRGRGKIYRFDLAAETLEPVPQGEIRPGHVYSRYDLQSGRWVWSKADSKGGLHYAMGEGTVQPARMFDLRGTDAERQRILEERAPELARLLAIQGARPTLKLDANGQWGLGPTPSVSSVYDTSTKERWEWHSDEPSLVIHASGRRWDVVDGRYVPGR